VARVSLPHRLRATNLRLAERMRVWGDFVASGSRTYQLVSNFSVDLCLTHKEFATVPEGMFRA
jgi:hypothetical protein